MKPAISLVELSHSHCLLAGSANENHNVYDMSDQPIDTFSGGDETLDDDDAENII